MRLCRFSYPDFGLGQAIGEVDWDDPDSQSLLVVRVLRNYRY